MSESNTEQCVCSVCKTALPPGMAAWGKKIGDSQEWLCHTCRDAAPGHDPLKIVEAYYAQFSDDAGGPDDERDHEDYRIGEYLVADGRIAHYVGPFGEIITKATLV